MKKITHQNLTKRLAQYGALTVAIAGVTDVNGQIIYTDIPDYTGGNPDPFYVIDFNNDTFGDLVIVGSPIPGYSSLAYVGVVPYSANVGSFLGSIPNAYAYPFALNSGDTISAGQTQWFGSAFGTMNFASCVGGGGSSNWCGGVTDKYLGLRFNILNGPGPGDDQTFYGWARLDVSADAFTWVLKDFAYNSTPGASILAGDTGSLGIGENELNKIKVVALNKSIGLYNLPASSSYNLYNMSGQEVLKGETNQREYVIEASTLASGVYIVELGDPNTNAVIRKKVVLQ